ncbi:hypothetical protein H257_11793 [Aphanomyces astaci]|uniref:Dynein light chain n=1 Tax=Aphanomyces astaci TaxID=112090 RepID=W4G1V1_APHAT|nr:hypothetical protein H257_11793 [Aphanomyces astaci]ETV73251.1 hypothetical protein H257_11793 [Aphanomyces astaci]|eukprot:XP_009837126.1 hypothetical protein H257_11793 [Aphanomyces astaci]
MVVAAGMFAVSSRPTVPLALQTVVLQAVERGAKAAKTLKELATVVQADLDDKQGRGWHVVAGKDFAVDIRYRKGCCAVVHNATARIKLVVYRTTVATTAPPAAGSIVLPSAVATTDSIKETVMESDMLAPFQSEVLSVCQRLAATPDDSDVLCSTLKNWLTQQYGHTWHVVVSTGSRDLVGAVHANPGTLLDVVFAKSLSTVSQTKKTPQHQQHVRFLVYQHGGFEASLDLITLLHRVCLVLAAMAGALFLFYRLSYRPECIENDTTCTDSDHAKAIAGDFGQFVATIVVVVLIGTASLLRVSRNAIRQKVKHV